MDYLIYKSDEHAYDDLGWLKSWHYFNFGNHFNPLREKFGALRTVNYEIIQPDSYFEMHHQKNLEIIVIPLTGTLLYKSSNDFNTTFNNQEVLITSCGSGIYHSIGNNSDSPVKYIQIWIHSKIKDIVPRQQLLGFSSNERNNIIQLIASPLLISDVLWINQNAFISRILLNEGNYINYEMHDRSNNLLIFNLNGKFQMEGIDVAINKYDSLEIREPDDILTLKAIIQSDLIVIEVARD